MYGNLKNKEFVEYTPNDRSVVKAWKEFGEYIDNWHTTTDLLNDLRFIIRNGEKILQAEYMVEVHFSKSVFRFEFGWGGNRDTEKQKVWLDIPTETE